MNLVISGDEYKAYLSLALNVQFIQNLSHGLESCNSGRHEREAEFVFNHSHNVKNRLYTCRIAIYKKQLE